MWSGADYYKWGGVNLGTLVATPLLIELTGRGAHAVRSVMLIHFPACSVFTFYIRIEHLLMLVIVLLVYALFVFILV